MNTLLDAPFDKLPNDPNTKTRIRTVSRFGKFDVCYEEWIWDGIIGESLIFLHEDIAHWSDERIKMEMLESTLAYRDHEITVSRKPPYIFVSFNFKRL